MRFKAASYVRQGEADPLVPRRWDLSSRMPDCRARLYPGEGHLLVVDHMVEILAPFMA